MSSEKLISYLEYSDIFVVFPEVDWEYDDGLFVVNKNTKEVTGDTLFNLICENKEVADDVRDPILL